MLLRKGNASWKRTCEQHLLHIWRNGALNIVSRRSWWLCFMLVTIHCQRFKICLLLSLFRYVIMSFLCTEIEIYGIVYWNSNDNHFFYLVFLLEVEEWDRILKRKGLDQILHSYNTYIFLLCCRPSFLTASIFTFLWGGWFMAPGCGSGKTLQSVGSRSSALISVTAPEAWESQIFV